MDYYVLAGSCIFIVNTTLARRPGAGGIIELISDHIFVAVRTCVLDFVVYDRYVAVESE